MTEGKKMDGEHTQKALMEITMKKYLCGGGEISELFLRTVGQRRRVSHQIPAESEMSRQNRATPHQIKALHLSPEPPSHFPVSFAAGRGPRGGGVVAGWWRVSGHFWVPKKTGSHYRAVSQLQSHQSRYTVQIRKQPCKAIFNLRHRNSLARLFSKVFLRLF